MRRALVTLGVVGLFAACGFPSVSYDQGSPDGGGDASNPPDSPVGADGSSGGDTASNLDGQGDGTTGDDATSSGGDAFDEAPGTDAAGDGSDSSRPETGTDGAVSGGDAMSDAAGDAAMEASGEGGDASPTDAPSDAAEEPTPDTGADAASCDKDGDHDLAKGGVCGSTDCDDNDARAYFGEPNYLTFAPTPVTMGDWNCDGVVETQFTTGFSCGGLNLGTCGTASGFTDTPACGATSSKFITCKVQAGVLCVTDTTTSNTQGCK